MLDIIVNRQNVKLSLVFGKMYMKCSNLLFLIDIYDIHLYYKYYGNEYCMLLILTRILFDVIKITAIAVYL